jgi:hypothetical protein
MAAPRRAVEIYKSKICDFFAQVRQQLASQIGRADVWQYFSLQMPGAFSFSRGGKNKVSLIF